MLRGTRLGAVVVVLLGVATPAPAAPFDPARASVVGGTTISVQQAPWAARVRRYAPDGRRRGSCSGSIIAPTEVITAEHCFRDKAGNIITDSAEAVAGSSRFDPASGDPVPQPGDAPQVVAAASRRYSTRYRDGGAYDVAILTLAAPLDLSGPAAQAIPILPPRASVPYGTIAGLAGFGLQDGSTLAQDGNLHALALTIADYRQTCRFFDYAPNVWVPLCAQPPPTAGTCQGDSGAGLVTGSPPMLVGVHVARAPVEGQPGVCPPGNPSSATNLAWLHQIIDGPSSPMRPRPLAPPPPPPPATPPALQLARRTGRLPGRTRLILGVRASGGQGVIAGSVVLYRRGWAGEAFVRVPTGSSADVAVPLNAWGRRAVRRHARVRFYVILTARQGRRIVRTIRTLRR